MGGSAGGAAGGAADGAAGGAGSFRFGVTNDLSGATQVPPGPASSSCPLFRVCAKLLAVLSTTSDSHGPEVVRTARKLSPWSLLASVASESILSVIFCSQLDTRKAQGCPQINPITGTLVAIHAKLRNSTDSRSKAASERCNFYISLSCPRGVIDVGPL